MVLPLGESGRVQVTGVRDDLAGMGANNSACRLLEGILDSLKPYPTNWDGGFRKTVVVSYEMARAGLLESVHSGGLDMQGAPQPL